MKSTKTERFLWGLVVLTIAVTASVVGYLKWSSSVNQSAMRQTRITKVRGADSYAVPKQVPVLVYHGIGTPSSKPSSVPYYNITLSNFKAQMAYLAAHNYSSITPKQYANWQHGIKQRLPAKPILLTFDDGFKSDQEATNTLAQYGFRGVLFVATGYADGDYGSLYAPWSTIKSMSNDGWIIQLHAGKCGHAYMPYAPESCSAKLNKKLITPTDFQFYIWPYGQTQREYRERVVTDISQGQQDIREHLGYASHWVSTVFAAPFGGWSNGQNPWLLRYWDHAFRTVFVQYIAARDQKVARAYDVRYRLELGFNAQSASYLASHIHNSAFTREGAGNKVTTGSTVNNNASQNG